MSSRTGVIEALHGTSGLRPLAEVLADERRLEALLPPTVVAVPVAELRARARRLLGARAAVERRRERLGDRPHFDAVAEHAVLEARADAEEASTGVRDAADASHRLLAAGNAAGVVMIGACVVAVASGMSPLSTPVAVGIMASAGGPIGGMVGGWRGRVAARRAHAVAVAAFTERLHRADADTMGDLLAARIRFDGWRRQCRELEAAVDEEAAAFEAWREVAGDDIDPASIGALCAALRQLRSVKLERLQLALGELAAARTPAAPVIDLATEEAPAPRDVGAGRRGRARRRSPNHPAIGGLALRDGRVLAPVAELPAIAAVANPGESDGDGDGDGASDDASDGASLVLDLLDRIKDKGLHLWTGE